MTDISIGQALLILIDQNRNAHPNYVKKLKKLYFSGFKTKAEFTQLEAIKKDPLLQNYQISLSPETINEDASRRYFETHLCFETMQNKLNTFPLELAKAHYASIRDAFNELGGDIDIAAFKQSGKKIRTRNYEAELIERKNKGLDNEDLIKGLSKREQDTIDRLFSGCFIETDHENAKEYADLFIQLKRNTDLSDKDKEKAIILLKSWRLAMILLRKTKKYQDLGLYSVHNIPGPDLYHKGIFLAENRGKISKEKAAQTHGTQAFGLIKSYMPLPKDDQALANDPFNYLKPAETSTYTNEAEWIKYSMGLLVHPYSNAISGTMLLQLRILLKLNSEGKLCLNDKDKLQNYLTLLISILTAHTGGHSLLEFTAPLSLPEVKSYFAFMKNFESISIKSLFEKNNEVAFENALSKTLSYHNQLLKRATLLAELKMLYQNNTPQNLAPHPQAETYFKAFTWTCPQQKKPSPAVFKPPLLMEHELASLKL